MTAISGIPGAQPVSALSLLPEDRATSCENLPLLRSRLLGTPLFNSCNKSSNLPWEANNLPSKLSPPAR